MADFVSASVLVNRVFRRITEGRTALFMILCTFLFLSNGNYYIFDKFHFGIYDIYFILFTLAQFALQKTEFCADLFP